MHTYIIHEYNTYTSAALALAATATAPRYILCFFDAWAPCIPPFGFGCMRLVFCILIIHRYTYKCRLENKEKNARLFYAQARALVILAERNMRWLSLSIEVQSCRLAFESDNDRNGSEVWCVSIELARIRVICWMPSAGLVYCCCSSSPRRRVNQRVSVMIWRLVGKTNFDESTRDALRLLALGLFTTYSEYFAPVCLLPLSTPWSSCLSSLRASA